MDLSTWKAGSKSKPQAAPIASMDGAVDEEDDGTNISAFSTNGTTSFAAQAGALSGGDEDDEDEIIEIPNVPDLPEVGEEVEEVEEYEEDFDDTQQSPQLALSPAPSDSRKRKRQRPADTFVSSGFMSINKRASPVSVDPKKSKPAVSGARRSRRDAAKSGILVPVVERIDRETLDSDVEDFTRGRRIVRMVKKEMADRDGDITYKVEFEDRHVEEVRLNIAFCILSPAFGLCLYDSCVLFNSFLSRAKIHPLRRKLVT